MYSIIMHYKYIVVVLFLSLFRIIKYLLLFIIIYYYLFRLFSLDLV
jgi:hypothetical protein